MSVAMLVTGTGVSASDALESPSAPRAHRNGLNLPEAVRLALENNPDLRASGARVLAAAGRAYQARNWQNPELELNAEDWPVSHGNGFSDAKQTIGILQTLPYPGKKSLDRRIGGAGVKLSEAELAVRQTEVVRDVKAAYFRVLASERLVTASRDLVSVAESSAATASKRVDAGSAAYQEQLRAEVQLEQARTELADFERDLAISRQALASVIGRPDLANAHLSGAMAESVDTELVGRVGENALDRHPSATAARAEVARADLEQRRARLEPYPDVRVGVSGGRIGETDQSIIQLGFAVPLPILDTGKGKKQEARANVDVAEAELVRVQYALLREWTSAQNRYSTAVEQVRNYRERLLPKAMEALRLVRTGFEEGKFGLIDLLDTQRTIAEAQLTYQQKLLEMNIAHAQLEALLRPQPVQPSTTK
jgi:cobalt-zinc-cadmium efflux system outer membrane protein